MGINVAFGLLNAGLSGLNVQVGNYGVAVFCGICALFNFAIAIAIATRS
jgi:hypothetical protein